MAGDWIKIEDTTPDKPEVIMMAAVLRSCDKDTVVGKLVRLWVWADANSVEGVDLQLTESGIDGLVNKRGFAQAMRKVGWLRGEDGALQLPNFGRHNGVTAKSRAMTNRRVARLRNGNGNGRDGLNGQRGDEGAECNGGSVTDSGKGNGEGVGVTYQKALPEKRREEKSIKSDDDNAGARGSEGGEERGSGDSRADSWPTLQEVVTYGETIGAGKDCCEAFWDVNEAAGWVMKGGQPVHNWRPLLNRYRTRWQAVDFREAQMSQGQKKGGLGFEGMTGAPAGMDVVKAGEEGPPPGWAGVAAQLLSWEGPWEAMPPSAQAEVRRACKASSRTA